MTTKLQKMEEQYFASEAAKILGEHWDIEIPPDEEQWPDVLVRHQQGDFGLEIREYHKRESRKGSPERELEKRREMALLSLADDYYGTTKIPIIVQWYGSMPMPNDLHQTLAKTSKDLEVWKQRRIDLGQKSFVYLTRLPDEIGDYKRWSVVSNSCGYVLTINASELQATVDAKAKKSVKYSSHLADIRLLIFSNRIRNSGKVQVSLPGKLDPGPFSRVYFMSYPESVIVLADKAGH